MIAALIGGLRALFQSSLVWMQGIMGLIVSREVLVRYAWIAFGVTLIFALYATVNAILSGLSFAMPSALLIGASWVMPSNFDECVTAYFATKLAIFTFEWRWNISATYVK